MAKTKVSRAELEGLILSDLRRVPECLPRDVAVIGLRERVAGANWMMADHPVRGDGDIAICHAALTEIVRRLQALYDLE